VRFAIAKFTQIEGADIVMKSTLPYRLGKGCRPPDRQLYTLGESEIFQRYIFVRAGLRAGEDLESVRLNDSGQKSGRRRGIPSKQRARRRRLAAI